MQLKREKPDDWRRNMREREKNLRNICYVYCICFVKFRIEHHLYQDTRQSCLSKLHNSSLLEIMTPHDMVRDMVRDKPNRMLTVKY